MRFFSHRRRGRLLLLVVPLACAATALFIANALAVHDEAFQLDGDVSASTQTHVPSGATQLYDWDSLFNANGTNKAPPTADFKSAGFNQDFNTNQNGSFNTSDATTYATGSKDTLPIGGGWQCNRDANVNSKIDIMNAYATAYTDPITGDQLLYFGLERNSNSGDGNVAFWFLQDGVGCVSPGGSTNFSGEHQDGDLLVVSAFTNGGTVSTIDVYRWNGGANGSLGANPVAHGADCAGEAVGDEACAEVNSPSDGTGGTITTPWSTANKQDGVGHSLRTAEFFEGGVNLTKKGLGGHCFNVFLADTRSSQSLTATLFDFSRGQLGQCSSSTTTTPKKLNTTTQAYENFTNGTATLPASGTLTVKDSAAITVSGASSFSGTVSFFICGPTAATSTTLCTTGGTAAGVRSITASGTVLSDPVNITQVGRYCWRAEFSGDSNAGVPPSSDSAATECFVVSQIPTQISTTPSAHPQDSATIQSSVSGDNLAAGGTVIFRLYGATIGGNTALQNCQAHGTTLNSGGLRYEETKTTGAAANSQTVATNNQSFAISDTSSASYYWRVTYAPPGADASHTGRQSDCVENVQATFTGDSGPGTLFP